MAHPLVEDKPGQQSGESSADAADFESHPTEIRRRLQRPMRIRLSRLQIRQNPSRTDRSQGQICLGRGKSVRTNEEIIHSPACPAINGGTQPIREFSILDAIAVRLSSPTSSRFFVEKCSLPRDRSIEVAPLSYLSPFCGAVDFNRFQLHQKPRNKEQGTMKYRV